MPAPPPFEPFQIGRYSCFERIGVGPHTEVLRSRLAGVAGIERHFAIKRLREPAAGDIGSRRRFVLAGHALMPLDDPHLVRAVEARDLAEGCFIASECVPGVDLGRVLAGGRLDEDAAALVASQVARGLAALAARRLVHGAVVTSNVLLTPDGDVRLSDAGLRVAVTGEAVEAEADGRALDDLVQQMLGGAPRRAALRAALAEASPQPEALAQTGDLARGRTALALAVRKALESAAAAASAANAATAASGAASAASAAAAAAGAPWPAVPPPMPPASRPLPGTPGGRTARRASGPRWRVPAAVGVALLAGVLVAVCIQVRRQEPPPPAHPVASARKSASPPSRHDPVPPAAPASPSTPPTPAATPTAPAPTPRAPAAPPAARTTPPVAPGLVAIASEPAGATLFVDGRSQGRTPAQVTLAPGRHDLVLLLAGMRMRRETVEVPGAEPAIALPLEPAVPPRRGSAGLKVRCRTAGLRIFVDGIDTGHACPSERLDLAPGRHTIALFVPARGGFSEKTLDLRVQRLSTRVHFSE